MFKKNLIIGLLAVTFAVCTALVAKKSVQGYQVGDKATDFKLKNIDGKQVALADFKDAKGFIVVFTCNHCPFAIAYEDRINALDQKYASKGYPVIAINPNDAVAYPDDNFDKMVERAKEKKFTFPYLVDDSQSIAKTFGATKTPHIYVLQKSKKDLVVKYIGAIDDNSKDAAAVKEKYVETAVDQLLAGQEVAVKETKAIGCSIKWKAN
jgi:peroxiredoxin